MKIGNGENIQKLLELARSMPITVDMELPLPCPSKPHTSPSSGTNKSIQID
jgi:hypothetical protein